MYFLHFGTVVFLKTRASSARSAIVVYEATSCFNWKFPTLSYFSAVMIMHVSDSKRFNVRYFVNWLVFCGANHVYIVKLVPNSPNLYQIHVQASPARSAIAVDGRSFCAFQLSNFFTLLIMHDSANVRFYVSYFVDWTSIFGRKSYVHL